MIENYNSLYHKAIQLKSKYETLENQYQQTLQEKVDLTNQMKDKLNKQMIYEDAISYMKEIIDVLSRSHIDHLESLLNSAVSTIFYDKNYRVEFEISEYRNSNCLNIYLIETLTDGTEIKTDIKDNYYVTFEKKKFKYLPMKGDIYHKGQKCCHDVKIDNYLKKRD